MSTQNTADLETVEGLRAALHRSNFLLAEAKGRLKRATAGVVDVQTEVRVGEEIVESLERMIARAESKALADQVEVEEEIPAEPVPSFVPCRGYGPVRSDGTDVYALSGSGVEVSIHAYASAWDGVVWSVCSLRLCDEVAAEANICEHVKDWAEAVRMARRLFAKWSVPAAVVAIAA